MVGLYLDALLAALAAVGARPHASLELLAYVVTQLLGMVPLTPGGLGFVEVGLAGTPSVRSLGLPSGICPSAMHSVIVDSSSAVSSSLRFANASSSPGWWRLK